MIGYIIPKSIQPQCAYVESQEGSILVNCATVPADEAGRRYLLPGDEIEFDIMQDRQSRIKIRATNVRVRTPREPVNLKTYRELGQVQRVGPYGLYAWLTREFFSIPDIIRLDSKEVKAGEKFVIGDYWEYSLEPPTDGRTAFDAYAATRVDVEVAA
jgi:hypothetical protein